jgi:HPt (histidine-containing phosphotransfer) domain-containing protein
VSGYKERLIQRRCRFVKRWEIRLQSTNQALMELQDDGGNRALLSQINKDFHQLAGAAGIYELQGLCSLAIAAEDLCGRQLRQGDGSACLPAFFSGIAELLTRLQAILQELVDETKETEA